MYIFSCLHAQFTNTLVNKICWKKKANHLTFHYTVFLYIHKLQQTVCCEKVRCCLLGPIAVEKHGNKIHSEKLGGHTFQSPLANTDNQGKSF